VSFQERHPENSVLLELADDECLLDSLILEMSCQLYYTIERDALLVCQGAILPAVWFHLTPDPSTESVKELATYEVRGAT